MAREHSPPPSPSLLVSGVLVRQTQTVHVWFSVRFLPAVKHHVFVPAPFIFIC